MTSKRCHPLGLHVADEVHEVAAVGFDRVVGQQRIADPRHQRPGDGGRSAAGLQGVGQEGFDLVGGRGVALEEVAALGDEGRARPDVAVRQGRELGIGVILLGELHLLVRYSAPSGVQGSAWPCGVPLVGENDIWSESGRREV